MGPNAVKFSALKSPTKVISPDSELRSACNKTFGEEGGGVLDALLRMQIAYADWQCRNSKEICDRSVKWPLSSKVPLSEAGPSFSKDSEC